ncbi:MAG: alpha/beta fold hydrolase [Ktedonobacteraceae bacterium]
MPTVKVNDIHVYYEIHGEGEPLVLIAGLSTDITAYVRIIGELSQTYRVIAFDNRGAGRTDKPDIPYSIEMMANDTAGLLNTLGIEQAHMLGISLGGRIAVDLTLRYPELVRSLILVSTFVSWFPLNQSGLRHKLMFNMPFLRKMGKKYPQPDYAFLRQRHASRNYDATDQLHKIHVPTLILHGKKDTLAPYRLAEEMHAGIAGSKMITFDGGHLFLFFQQKQFLDAVFDFLASTRGANQA